MKEAGIDELKEDDAIIVTAQKIMETEDLEGATVGKYNINVKGDIKGIVGDISGGNITQTIS